MKVLSLVLVALAVVACAHAPPSTVAPDTTVVVVEIQRPSPWTLVALVALALVVVAIKRIGK